MNFDLTRLAGALCASASLSILATHAFAADAATDPTVNEVVVTGQHPDTQATSGSKTNTPIVETPQSISVVDRVDLDLRVVDNLNEAVHFTAGVGPDTRGNTAGRYDLMTIRGFTPDQYLDGLHLISSANGYAVPQIDIDTLDRVEIVKGPASVLYGEGSPGGIIALSSKLPTQDTFGEVQVGGGSYGTANGSFDFGGKLDQAGTLTFRLDGEARRSNTETNHTLSERYGINPSVTWRPDDKTSWTLLYSYQHDPKGGDYGAMPVQGSLLANPNGQIPRDFYDGEENYEKFDRVQQSITSLFKRDLGIGDWEFRQNARYMRITTDYRSIYHVGFFDADYSTLSRYAALADEGIDNFTIDNQLAGTLKTGPLTHTLIFGVDYQHTGQTEVAGFGEGAGGQTEPSLNVFSPVYGSKVYDPAISFNVRLNLQQTGVYAQDQIAWGGFRLMLSGRNDWVDSAQYSLISKTTASSDPSKFTGRAGLLYLFDNGLAPYVLLLHLVRAADLHRQEWQCAGPYGRQADRDRPEVSAEVLGHAGDRRRLRPARDQCGHGRSQHGRPDLHRRRRSAVQGRRTGRLDPSPARLGAEGQLHLHRQHGHQGQLGP